MTKFFTARNLVSLASLLLLVFLLSFSENKVPSVPDETTCAAEEEPGIGNELFWETLSRQFSGSVSSY